MILPEAYIVQKFYQYAGQPKFNRLAKTYQGGCPVCREGKSWGKKRRLFYVIKDNFLHCHNCGWHSNPMNWIVEVSGMTVSDIYKEADEYDLIPAEVNVTGDINSLVKKVISKSLPEDSINLFDEGQISYFKANPFVQSALTYIKKRKLNTAYNKPKSLYLSLKDKTHKNRLIIPFYDVDGKLIFYQSRTITENYKLKLPKYLGKVNSDKSLFNIDKIKEDLDNIVIIEGPIDAFFVENGVAVAGINENSESIFTSLQKSQINKFPFHERIIALDSQWQDKASFTKTKILLEKGHNVFIWPRKFGEKFKDFNEMCMGLNIEKVPTNFIVQNSYKGLEGLVKLNLLSIS
jgi:hypothetical protein